MQESATAQITFSGNSSVTIAAHERIISDDIFFQVQAGQTLCVNLYFCGFYPDAVSSSDHRPSLKRIFFHWEIRLLPAGFPLIQAKRQTGFIF